VPLVRPGRCLTTWSDCQGSHPGVAHTRWCWPCARGSLVCDVMGESPERVKFEARESVRVSLALKFADVAQQAEHNVANVDVAGSSPAFRSIFRCTFTLLTRVERTHIINDARLAQLAKSSRLVSGRSSVRTRQWAPHFSCRRGGTGRHASPRSWWRKPCRFKSGRRHQPLFSFIDHNTIGE
jgi:hypothetical protein